MKKSIVLLSASALIGTILLVGCAKEDVTAPVITITGGNSMFSSLNATFTAPAATATDDEDGDLTSTITTSGTVNKDLAGNYTITYSATDAAGNIGTENLVVTVRNDAYAWADTYNVFDTVAGSLYFNYAQTVTASTTVNNRLHFNKFADYTGNINIYADVTGASITLPSQTTGLIGSNSHVHTFSGTGVQTSTGFVFSNYTDTDVTGGGSTTGVMWFK